MGKKNGVSSQKGSSKKHSGKFTEKQKGLKARESEERKGLLRNKIEIKRLATNVQKAKAICQGEGPEPPKEESKEDALYQLKGAARPAAEFYAPKKEIVEKKDLLVEYSNRLWDVKEGHEYLIALFEYATALHNLMNKSKEAIEIFEEMLDLDHDDHMRVREQILRCYLDDADALKARELLEKYSSDSCCFFMYSRALIEYLSCSLNEPGSSLTVRDEALQKAVEANPYLIWVIAYHKIFEAIIEESVDDLLEDVIQDNLNKSGSIEEAFTFFKTDLGIWLEIDGIVEWIHDFIVEMELTPPEIDVVLPEIPLTADEEHKTLEQELEYFHAMYLDMFKTGCEEIEQQLLGK